MQVDEYENPSLVLQQLSESLSQLDHLDLSCTNLSGYVQDLSAENALAGWPPDRKLSFLGLLGCPSKACFRQNLPAHRIAGEAKFEQLLVALEAYAGIQPAMCKIFRSLLHIILDGHEIALSAAARCLDLVLELTQSHTNEWALLVLNQLVHILHLENISPLRVRQLVLLYVNTIERNVKSYHVVFNCCCVLYQVRTFKQLQFLYERLVKLLLGIAKDPPLIEQDEDQNRLGAVQVVLDLLREIVRQVDVPEKKLFFGEIGGVRVALAIIEQYVIEYAGHEYEIIVSCWRLLSEALEEIYHNAKLFIDFGGLELFISCARRFRSDCTVLYSVMLEVISNVSDWRCLRGYLKSDQIFAYFLEMLRSTNDDIQISYNTAILLSRLLADGEHLWHHHVSGTERLFPKPLAYSHAAIGQQIIAAIERWDESAVSIYLFSHRSRTSIISMLQSFDSLEPHDQYLTAWALQNLLLVTPHLCFLMLLHEGALDHLVSAIAAARSSDKLRDWLVLTANRIGKRI